MTLFLTLAIGLGTVGCQIGTYSLPGKSGVPMADPGTSTTRTVDGGGWSHYLFWGLLPVGVYDVEKDLSGKLKKGDTVVEVTLHESNTFTAGLLALITVGIYRPRVVEMEATIHGGSK